MHIGRKHNDVSWSIEVVVNGQLERVMGAGELLEKQMGGNLITNDAGWLPEKPRPLLLSYPVVG